MMEAYECYYPALPRSLDDAFMENGESGVKRARKREEDSSYMYFYHDFSP